MRSMTGYGHWTYRNGSFAIEASAKSYNNRYLDISCYLSPALQAFESHIDEEIRKAVGRGHIDISMKLHMIQSEVSLNLDRGLLSSYISIYGDIAEATGCRPSFSDYGLSHCLAMLCEAKDREGEGTRQDLERLARSFEDSLAAIEARSSELGEHYSRLLQEKFDRLSGEKPDQSVFMTELAAILVRYSINEELSRLKVHLKEYHKLLAADEPVGKKLDFLCQEMQRECNTIASKSQLVEINLAVVSMKDNIEDIREQVRNIE